MGGTQSKIDSFSTPLALLVILVGAALTAPACLLQPSGACSGQEEDALIPNPPRGAGGYGGGSSSGGAGGGVSVGSGGGGAAPETDGAVGGAEGGGIDGGEAATEADGGVRESRSGREGPVARTRSALTTGAAYDRCAQDDDCQLLCQQHFMKDVWSCRRIVEGAPPPDEALRVHATTGARCK